MEEKKCKECQLVKLKSNFYGLQGECKDCTKKRVKYREDALRKDPAFVEKERVRSREKYRRLYVGTQKASPEVNKRYWLKYPEKKIAKERSQYLKKPFDCAEKHHWSYLEEHWVDVIWLTKKHHMKAHRFIVYDQERMMYRRCDTNELLDTKEKHQAFITYCIENKED